MKLEKFILPQELDADSALAIVLAQLESLLGSTGFSCSYEFNGVSERTALGDNVKITVKNRQNGVPEIRFQLKRDSLYHILPEYLFHPLDCYLGIEGDTQEYEKRYKEQEEQKQHALAYFRFFDQQYQQLRNAYQAWLDEHIFAGNQFLSDYLTSGKEVRLTNPFVKTVYGCLPWLKDYRGNQEMIRTVLVQAFQGRVTIEYVETEVQQMLSDQVPCRLRGRLSNLYCAPTFLTSKKIWNVFYQTEINSYRHLCELKQQIGEFRDFFADWFLPVETQLVISFGDRKAKPILTPAGQERGVFLNYSTQLI